MKKYSIILFIVILGIIGFGVYQQLNKNPESTIMVTNFEECASVPGNPIIESYPRQCIYNGQNFTEVITDTNQNNTILCQEEQRRVDVCTADYTPVCATVEIQCITTPCNPIKQTFSNSCNACKNSLVQSYIPGECPDNGE